MGILCGCRAEPASCRAEPASCFCRTCVVFFITQLHADLCSLGLGHPSTLHANKKIIMFYDPKSDKIYNENRRNRVDGQFRSNANESYHCKQLSAGLYRNIAQQPTLAARFAKFEAFFHEL